MKKIMILLAAFAFVVNSCNDPYKIPKPKPPIDKPVPPGGDNGGNNENEPGKDDPTPPEIKEPQPSSLKISKGWEIDEVQDGIRVYTFSGKDDITKVVQNVSVCEIDMEMGKYKVEFKYVPGDGTSTSSSMLDEKTVAAVNGCYELASCYIKVDGQVISETDPGNSWYSFWKHEAAFLSDDGVDIKIMYAGSDYKKSLEAYKLREEKNIFTSAPMLIDNFEPRGKTFINDVPEKDGPSNESLIWHQGVQNAPRTVYALTEKNQLLLVTFDGRNDEHAVGMKAAEVTEFLEKYFAPQYAINMDGGGSTTLCVKGAKVAKKPLWVVNYPSGGNWDRNHERNVNTFLLVKER